MKEEKLIPGAKTLNVQQQHNLAKKACLRFNSRDALAKRQMHEQNMFDVSVDQASGMFHRAIQHTAKSQAAFQ